MSRAPVSAAVRFEANLRAVGPGMSPIEANGFRATLATLDLDASTWQRLDAAIARLERLPPWAFDPWD